MKFLVDINHPAHVHFFKHFIWEMEREGHEIVITASKKEMTYFLLDNYGFNYVDLGTYGKKAWQKALKIPLMALKMFWIMLRERPDVAMGIGSSRITHGAVSFLKIKTLVFTDTEHAKEQILLYKPFATKIVTPVCFWLDMGKKQVRYNGYQELAYLHPNYFSPDKKVIEELNLELGERFFILRFVSWGASHDIGQKGFSLESKRKIIQILAKKGRVIISSEAELPKEFEQYRMRISPEKMHDLLAFASMYIGEGGTMASESAILGTPAVFVNTLDAGTFEELEEKYGLMYRFKDDEKAVKKISDLLDDNSLESEWKQRQKTMLEEKSNVTVWIKKFVSEL